ncbi:TIGR03032 family protein [Vibrio navarrensis]|uniref:TIGR03032 family protein n=1 Tax=Vibrio navarrensis TaxID=29495 RepID=A0AAI9CSR2_9VIBR|nr:TIGR03032 family protein [Vibrio navarrensis]
MAENREYQSDAQISDSEEAKEFEVTYCERFAPLLQALNSSLIVSSYSANSLLLLSSSDGENIHVSSVYVPRLLGIAINPEQNKLTFAAYGQLLHYQRLENPHQHKVLETLNKEKDVFFVPCSSTVTGFLNTHDMAYTEQGLVFVNSSFSCIATTHPERSFKPLWQPHFISELTPEDRCHLNGMAVVNGQPEFVSCFTSSDAAYSWKSELSHQGVIIRTADNFILCDGLSLPHTPRFHQGKLYFCESGAGRLWCIQNPYAASKDELNITCVGEYPGFTRGLKCVGDLALMGLSRLRPAKDGSKRNTDMPILQKQEETWGGIVAVDLRSGEMVARMQFSEEVAQIYDVDLLAESVNPHIFAWDAEEVSEVYLF